MRIGWGGLLILHLWMIGALFLLSSAVVIRLARRRRARGPEGRPAWHLLLAHVGLGFPLSVILPGAGLLAWAIVPVHLFVKIREQEELSGTGSASPPWVWRASEEGRSLGLATFFALSGVGIPWGVGLGVKLYLDSLGRPTLPISPFLSPSILPILFVLTLGAWGLPFLVLASMVAVPWRVGRPSTGAYRASLLPVWLACGAGALAGVAVFVSVFWNFDTLMILVPLGIPLLVPSALGYVAGWWILGRRGTS
jgi:hypothetical protein